MKEGMKENEKEMEMDGKEGKERKGKERKERKGGHHDCTSVLLPAPLYSLQCTISMIAAIAG
jgi:hypothetical protein